MLRKLFSQKTAEWGTTALVLASAGLAGHQAALGMTQAQFMGAATAILATWPAPVPRTRPMASGRRMTSAI